MGPQNAAASPHPPDPGAQEIARGENLALLGRNGAGRPTASSLLPGLDRPDSGRVELCGADPARTRRGPGPDPARAGLVGAMPAARRVDRLSGGHAQRLRSALAVAGDPWLIVLDEPTAALDVEALPSTT